MGNVLQVTSAILLIRRRYVHLPSHLQMSREGTLGCITFGFRWVSERGICEYVSQIGQSSNTYYWFLVK